MIKKIFLFLILISFMCNTEVVFANSYYVNENGVNLTKEEYDFFSTMFWDDCQKLIDNDDYRKFVASDIINGEIDVKKIEFSNTITRSSSFSDKNRSLKISKSCSSDCFISTVFEWHNTPNVKSYDVMGAYFENTSLLNTPITKVVTSSSSKNINEIKKNNIGFGFSFLLPSESNIVISQTFKAKKGGTIYASYQHAIKNSTLAKSKNYSFSKIGYGNVFNFKDDSKDIYDGMAGVNIQL